MVWSKCVWYLPHPLNGKKIPNKVLEQNQEISEKINLHLLVLSCLILGWKKNIIEKREKYLCFVLRANYLVSVQV